MPTSFKRLLNLTHIDGKQKRDKAKDTVMDRKYTAHSSEVFRSE